MWWRTAAVAILALVGCRVEADYTGTDFTCSDGVCPAGRVCSGGRCVLPGTPDAAEPDAPGTPDAAPADAPPDAPTGPIDAGLPPNLVANPDLEVDFTGWEAYQGTLRATMTMPHGGLGAIVGCKDPTGTTSFFSVYTDVINGVAGDVPYPAHYTASVWVRASFSAAELAPPSLYLVLREGGGATADVDHAGPAVTPITTTWVQLTTDAVIEQPDRNQLILIVWPDDVVDDTCFAVDDAYVGRID